MLIFYIYFALYVCTNLQIMINSYAKQCQKRKKCGLFGIEFKPPAQITIRKQSMRYQSTYCHCYDIL